MAVGFIWGIGAGVLAIAAGGSIALREAQAGRCKHAFRRMEFQDTHGPDARDTSSIRYFTQAFENRGCKRIGKSGKDNA